MTDPHHASSIFPSFPRPFICFSSRQNLLHACRGGIRSPFTIISPLHAGASLGIDWWLQLIKGSEMPSILDCGANAALALEALEKGIDGVICRDFRAALPEYMSESLRDRLATCRPAENELAVFPSAGLPEGK